MLHEVLSLGRKDVQISALVRSAAQVDAISKLGVEAIVFKGLDDLDVIKSAAAEHDGRLFTAISSIFVNLSHTLKVVINCASAMDLQASLALLEGLQNRRKATGRDVHFLQVSFSTPSPRSSA